MRWLRAGRGGGTEDLPEVKSAAVDLASNSAKISFEGDALDMARIKKAVEDTGFTVEG